MKVTATAATARPGRSRTVLGTALFVLGFSAVFASEGVAFGGLGAVLRTHSTGLTQILGAVTIVLGLMFAGVFDRFPIAGRILQPSVRPRAGLAGAPALGVLFGVSWTPCIGPTPTVVLGLAMTRQRRAARADVRLRPGSWHPVPDRRAAVPARDDGLGFASPRRTAHHPPRAPLVAIGVLELTGA